METDDEPATGPAFALIEPNRASDPALATADIETAQLVWDAAAMLSAEDYTLLDLHLRQGFEAEELTAALGLRKGAVYTRLTRLRKSLGDAVVALLLVRSGRRECPRLDAMLAALPADMPERDLNRRVLQHASECPDCREARRKLVSPLVLFGSLAPVPFPAELQVAAWARIQESVATRPQAAPGFLAAPRRIGLLSLAGLAFLGLAGWMLLSRSPEATATLPIEIRGVSHTPGVPSSISEVEVAWEPPANARGFAILWDRQPGSIPASTEDLPATETGTKSPPLAPGEWFVHVRVLSGDGEWAEPVHAGPFVISAPEPSATATPTPSAATSTPIPATATPSQSPTPEPEHPTSTPVPAALVRNTPILAASPTPSLATSTATPPPTAAATSTPVTPDVTPTPFPATATPAVTETPTPSPTNSPSPTPMNTPTPTNSPSPTPTNTPPPPTSTATIPPPTSTPLPTNTPTVAPPTSTPTIAPPLPTPTPTPTGEVPSA